MTAEDDAQVTCTITSTNPLPGLFSVGISTQNFAYAPGRTVRFDPPAMPTPNGSLAFDGTQHVDYVAGPVWALDVV